jgi:undecaprenyl-phosphate 4-deoxy-4-formamido-L-arabinose transferase
MAQQLSVVVPVYRSASTLADLVARLAAVLSVTHPGFELILVDDGSPDDSWPKLLELARQHAFVRPMRLMRNFGQHNALLCGIRAARGNLIVTMDDDLQNPPEEIPKLLAALEGGYDVVYGVRARESHGLARNLASVITKLVLQNAMGAETARKVTAFRAFRAELRQGFAGYSARYVSIDVLLTWSTTRFGTVVVAHEPRRSGESNYTFGKLVTHALNMVTGFSVLPLQVASVMGFVFTLIGFALMVGLLVVYFTQGAAVQGFTFLAVSVALFSGVQLLALGIIGEYLARMYSRIMGQPPYVVRERTGEGETPKGPVQGEPHA